MRSFVPSPFLAALAALLVLGLGLLVTPVLVAAQAGKVARVGVLSSTLPRSAVFYRALEERLRELGYEEGTTLVVHFRSAGGNADRLPGLAAELIRAGVDVVVAGGPEATLRAARQASATVPIVMVAIDYDPIARGYVASLARPGGRVTGVFIRQLELTRKRLELFKEALPALRRVAVLWDTFSADQLREAEAAALAIGLQPQPLERGPGPYDFDRAFAAARANGAEALLILASPVFFRDRARLLEAAATHRLPTMAAQHEWVDSGGLLSYGANYVDMWRRGADYVDMILKGGRPSDLPVAQPDRFELVLNRKTAAALGVALPPALVLRADRVVE